MLMPQENKTYTYADYLTWSSENSWEIIEGIPYMQESPSWQHQAISRELMLQFGEYLRNMECQIFAAPFDLRLTKANEEDKDTTNVFQPDLVVVCDKSKLIGTGYYGIPSLVIEIVSPSTAESIRI